VSKVLRAVVPWLDDDVMMAGAEEEMGNWRAKQEEEAHGIFVWGTATDIV